MDENKLILDQYKKIIDMLALFFGDSIEVVLHSLDNLEESVVYIHNGQKTARNIGSPVTDKALQILENYNVNHQQIVGPYKTISRDGNPMKSVTSIIVNSKQEPIGMICINFDLATPMSDLFKILFDNVNLSNSNESNEHFASDIQDLLSTTVNQIKERVLADKNVPSRQRNKAIVQECYKQGLFSLRNAANEIAVQLGISRDLVYLHLRALKANALAQNNPPPQLLREKIAVQVDETDLDP